ncbi:MarR family transcriptional regulator [Rhodococcus fascians]|nr:MarR family transcriptional regulator [Rhodococcus fascians]MBY4237889.1 MarR family transcriptional regulator [Rhodococcus fascians]MBY4253360.1 MarR family transcriptional regulator [Rhodococcus fascians]MBY4268997.1 MarR family transcriptional regulator [Rhodococcus fascians]MBY4275050.1 MarR family transcriptional regulator [Rhodococcus fascians]
MTGLDEGAVELGFALVRTSASHLQELERQVHRPNGSSFSGFRIMYMVWLFEEIEARDLARLAGVSRQTTSTVLANLESAGLISRSRTSETDRRLVAIKLTSEGTRSIQDAFAVQNKLEAEWFDCLDSDEKLQFKGFLDRVSIRIAESSKKGDLASAEQHSEQ